MAGNRHYISRIAAVMIMTHMIFLASVGMSTYLFSLRLEMLQSCVMLRTDSIFMYIIDLEFNLMTMRLYVWTLLRFTLCPSEREVEGERHYETIS